MQNRSEKTLASGRRIHPSQRLVSWDIVLDGNVVDTVLHSVKISKKDVKDMLIQDGYDNSVEITPTPRMM